MSQKTVREIVDMIDSGNLHYNQSTQRKFIYADMDAQVDYGEMTKAGSVIHSILEENIQLPAVYFWNNADTNQLNIHDGKQRILSIYYFIKPNQHTKVCTIRNGRQIDFSALSQEDKDFLLDYKLDVVEKSGTSEEEERSFFIINTNSVNLTNYEAISGMLHGTWLDGFEAYIDSQSKTLTAVKPVGRGEQARLFLYACFNRPFEKTRKGSSNPDSIINNDIRAVRNNRFDAKSYSFDSILYCYNELSTMNLGLKDESAVRVANFIVRSGYSVDDVCDLYRRASRKVNDIKKWDQHTHECFIKSFVQSSVELDGLRFFTDEVKQALYSKNPGCAHPGCTETSYKKLEVDHITPWSQGGRTILGNAQLLCKSHNAGKGNRA